MKHRPTGDPARIGSPDPKGPKDQNREYVGQCRVSILGIVTMVLGTYLLLGSLDP